jgi:hypothetical protein
MHLNMQVHVQMYVNAPHLYGTPLRRHTYGARFVERANMPSMVVSAPVRLSRLSGKDPYQISYISVTWLKCLISGLVGTPIRQGRVHVFRDARHTHG